MSTLTGDSGRNACFCWLASCRSTAIAASIPSSPQEEDLPSMEVPIDFVIRSAGAIDPETLRVYAERRLAFALRRFENHTRHATVRFGDLNGPKGGVDSCCTIALQLQDGRHIDVKAITAWPFASVTLAAKRLNAVVRRELGKRQLSVRRPRRNRSDIIA
jgi:putative sigma-54 modulation protein